MAILTGIMPIPLFFKMKLHKKKCPICGKEFASFSSKQVEYNFLTHFYSCKSKANASIEVKAKGKPELADTSGGITKKRK